jgi:hypothetical protein
MLLLPLRSSSVAIVRGARVAWSRGSCRGQLLFPSNNKQPFLRQQLQLLSTTTTTTMTSSSSSTGVVTSGDTDTTISSTTQPSTQPLPPPQERPFRILGLQQVAIGSTDRTALRELWINVLGLVVTQSNVRIESENVMEDILTTGGGGPTTAGSPFAVEIDLMTPIDATKSPKVRTRRFFLFCL